MTWLLIILVIVFFCLYDPEYAALRKEAKREEQREELRRELRNSRRGRNDW